MITEALSFLIDTLLGLFIFVLLLRFYMQLLRAPWRNPVGETVVAITDFIVRPVRRFIPGVWGIDWSTLLLAWVLEFILLLGLYLLRGGVLGEAPAGVFLTIGAYAAIQLLKFSIYLVMGAIFIQAILSWVNPYSAISPVLDALTRPFLRIFRKVIPPLGNVDLSSLFALITCQLLLIVLKAVVPGF